MRQQNIGRVLLVRWDGPLDGTGPAAEQVAATAACSPVRFLLLDITQALYADRDGLRWLLRLRSELESAGKDLRIAARPGGKVWRNIALLEAGLEVYPSVARAWKAPAPELRGAGN